MPGTHGFIQTKLDHWSINMNKNFNCNDYIYITVIGQVNKFFYFKNSKLKSKIGCYQIYLLKNIKEITKTQENFYFFSKTKQVCK